MERDIPKEEIRAKLTPQSRHRCSCALPFSASPMRHLFFLIYGTTSTTSLLQDTPFFLILTVLRKFELLPNIYPLSTTEIRSQLRPPDQKWQRMFLPLVYFPASHGRLYRQSTLRSMSAMFSNGMSFSFELPSS